MKQDRQSPPARQADQSAAAAQAHQRQALAEDIAVLVVRQYRRHIRVGEHATETADDPIPPVSS